MDLVAGVRKEGSRGGRDAFKWDDVKDSQHRENYLGHSLMAPVGRWQKNKDLSWYAKGDDSAEAQAAAAARAEEIRKIKEAERDALSAALGFAVEPRMKDSQIAGAKEVEKAIKETGEGDEEGGKGVGFGGYLGAGKEDKDTIETQIGSTGERGGLDGGRVKVDKRRRRDIRSPDRERRHRRHDDGHHRSHRRHRSRSRSRDERPRRHGRSRSHERYKHSDQPRGGDGSRISRDEHRYSRTYQKRSLSPNRHHRRNNESREDKYRHR